MRAYLEGVRTYDKNSFAPDAALAVRVERECAKFLDRWGYRVPAAA
jgi:hypothetical protein